MIVKTDDHLSGGLVILTRVLLKNNDLSGLDIVVKTAPQLIAINTGKPNHFVEVRQSHQNFLKAINVKLLVTLR